MNKKKKEEIVQYYKKNYPNITDEELALNLAMDDAELVAHYVCVCGRRHEIEYNPPEHGWECTGSICACGHEIKFGK